MPLSGPGILSLGSRKPGLTIFKTGSSVINPSSVSGLKLWVKADTGTLDTGASPTTTDGTAIRTWQDQSGGSKNLTNAGAGLPVLKNSIVNSKPVIRFTAGSSQFLSNLSFLTGAETGLWMFAVVSLRAGTAFAGLLSTVSGAGANDYQTGAVGCLGGAGAPTAMDYFGVEGVKGATNTDLKTDSTAFGTFAVLALDYYNATTTTLYVNGTAQGTRGATNATVAAQNIFLGARWYGSTTINYASIDVAEYLIYNSNVSTTDRTAIIRYLGNRYGITVA